MPLAEASRACQQDLVKRNFADEVGDVFGTIFIATADGDISEKVRSLTGLGKRRKRPQMVFLNIKDNGAFYRPHKLDDTSGETVLQLLADFKSGASTRCQLSDCDTLEEVEE